MRYVVTGGFGFIGSNLVRHLLDLGHEVLAIDNGYMGKRENLPAHHDRLQVEFCSDLKIQGRWEQSESKCNGTAPDGVFHLAAVSSAPLFAGDPALAMANNADGFNTVAQFCCQTSTPLVFASTSSMMRTGKPEPQTFYELSKYHNEKAAEVFHRELGLQATGLRFFSVYGPREEHKGPYANLATQFIKAVEKGEEVVVYGDGSQTRDFVFVHDLVRALVVAMEERHADSEVDGGIRFYSVGTGNAYSLNRLIFEIETVTGKLAKVVYVPNPIRNYVLHTLAEPGEFIKGWTPAVSLVQGLRETKKFLEVGEHG